MRTLWIGLFSFRYKKQINDILSCAAIQARQGDSIMKRITRIIRPIICIVVLLVAMTTAVRGCYQRETEPIDIPGTSAPQPSAPLAGEVIPSVDRQTELAEARAKNPDTVAWLYIPGAEVDDPVMQAEDNGYYLKLDKNTTIFGHSASNCDPDGVRFTKLYRYMDADFVKEHPYIYLSVDGEDMIFQITALFVTDIGFDYIAPDPTGDDLTSFFETIARKNWLDFDGVTFSEEDTVLTLSTCCRKYDKANSGNQRLVVMAKLLPEGATAQEFSVSLVDSLEMPKKKSEYDDNRTPILAVPTFFR